MGVKFGVKQLTFVDSTTPNFTPLVQGLGVDLSNRLATIHQRSRQDRQTHRQRSDSIGQTVLQTVTQKSKDSIKTLVKSSKILSRLKKTCQVTLHVTQQNRFLPRELC